MVVRFLNRNRRRPRIARYFRLWDLTIHIIPVVTTVTSLIVRNYVRVWRGPHPG